MPDNTLFQGNPVNISISRSRFNMPHKHTTSFKAGELVPVFSYSDVLPGDTWKMSVTDVIRSLTPIVPVMDDAFIDVYAFFVPHELTLSRRYMSPAIDDGVYSFAAVMGAQDSLLNMPVPDKSLVLPAMIVNADASDPDDVDRWTESLAGYLGMPPYDSVDNGAGYVVNALEPLAYYSIWNEYFRDPNTQSSVTYDIYTIGAGSGQLAAGSKVLRFTGADAGITAGTQDVDKLPLAPVSVFHGYFGSALPWPQRNSTAVEVPIVQGDLAPVVAGGNTTTHSMGNTIYFGRSDGSWTGSHSLYVTADAGSNRAGLRADSSSYSPGSNSSLINQSNLFADLSGVTANVTINQLRLLFATQKYYEKLARGGNRLSSMAMSLFNVRDAHAGANEPEYLGGFRAPLGVHQVTSTAETTNGDEQTPIGELGAFGHSADHNYLFSKSFTTWGTIMVVACVRKNESFYQGIAKRHRRFKALDFYSPTFANIGEQPVYEEEIYAAGDDGATVVSDLGKNNDTLNRSVFGYQEAWAEYRYLSDRISGHMIPASDYGFWTYCNDFLAGPTLKGYLNAKNSAPDAFDRTFKVTGKTAGFQFFGQFYFDITVVRPMPLHSIPGLIDHN